MIIHWFYFSINNTSLALAVLIIFEAGKIYFRLKWLYFVALPPKIPHTRSIREIRVSKTPDALRGALQAFIHTFK
jgi:hypothetical protein